MSHTVCLVFFDKHEKAVVPFEKNRFACGLVHAAPQWRWRDREFQKHRRGHGKPFHNHPGTPALFKEIPSLTVSHIDH